MKNRRIFDVLVVYSNGMALSARTSTKGAKPFSKIACDNDYDKAYVYLIDSLTEKGLNTAFTTAEDIVGAGTVSAYWMHDKRGWHGVRGEAYAQVIFDKLSPQSKLRAAQRALLFSSPKITPFNDPALYNLFFDKLALAETVGTHTIPTVSINTSDIESIEIARARLRAKIILAGQQNDFSGDYILKDRYGAAGNHVYHISRDNIKSMSEIMQEYPKTSFIMQPMLLFEDGYHYKKWTGKTEIRLIFYNEKIVQTYLRIAETTLGLCNGHQGGNIVYQPIKSIPKKVRNATERVIELLPRHDSLYALDFVISNAGKPYLLEGNTGPGLNWDRDNIDDVKGAKSLMRIIAKILEGKVEQGKPKPLIDSTYTPVFAN